MTEAQISEWIRPFRCEVPVPVDPEDPTRFVIRSGSESRDVIWRISEAREKVIFHTGRDPRYLLLGRLDYAELLAEMRRGFRYATTSDPLEATEILGMIPIVDPTTDRRVTPILESQSLMITIRPEAFV